MDWGVGFALFLMVAALTCGLAFLLDLSARDHVRRQEYRRRAASKHQPKVH